MMSQFQQVEVKTGINTINYFCCNWTAIKLRQDFDALSEMLSEFSSGHICVCYKGLGHFHLDGENLQMQNHFAMTSQFQQVSRKQKQIPLANSMWIVAKQAIFRKNIKMILT